MIPKRISNFTHAYGAPAGWDEEKNGNCAQLHVRISKYDANIYFESSWEPTPDELAALNAGGSVILRILGGQPPVMLYAEPAPNEE